MWIGEEGLRGPWGWGGGAKRDTSSLVRYGWVSRDEGGGGVPGVVRAGEGQEGRDGRGQGERRGLGGGGGGG